jgi:phytoene synthase
LPPDCRAAIHAARLVYSEIGHLVAAGGYDSVSGRAVVSKGRKLALVAQACAPGWLMHAPVSDAALTEVQFLIDAVAAEPRRAPARAPVPFSLLMPMKGFRRRTVGVVELFERVLARENTVDDRFSITGAERAGQN